LSLFIPHHRQGSVFVACRDADMLLVANKGGFAFAVDPDTGEKVWATAVGKLSDAPFNT